MKYPVLLLILAIPFAINAQAYPGIGGRNIPENEVKFNIGLFLATTTVEGSYERFLSPDTSVGGFLYFDNDPDDFNGDFGFGPFFRAYFGFRPRSGFFAEAFGLYHEGRDTDIPNGSGSYNTLALGLGIGNKWVTRSEKFLLEPYVGFGRNINPAENQDAFIFRGGLSVGYRF